MDEVDRHWVFAIPDLQCHSVTEEGGPCHEFRRVQRARGPLEHDPLIRAGEAAADIRVGKVDAGPIEGSAIERNCQVSFGVGEAHR